MGPPLRIQKPIHRRRRSPEQDLEVFHPRFESKVDDDGTHVVSVLVQGKRWRRRAYTHQAARAAAAKLALDDLLGLNHPRDSPSWQNAHRSQHMHDHDDEVNDPNANPNQPDDDLYSVPDRPAPVPQVDERRRSKRIVVSNDEDVVAGDENIDRPNPSSSSKGSSSTRRRRRSRFSDATAEEVRSSQLPSTLRRSLSTRPTSAQPRGDEGDTSRADTNADHPPSASNTVDESNRPSHEQKHNLGDKPKLPRTHSPEIPSYRIPRINTDAHQISGVGIPRLNSFESSRRENTVRQPLPPRNSGSDRSVRLASHPLRTAPRRHRNNRRSNSPLSATRSDLSRPSRRRPSPPRNSQYYPPYTTNRSSHSSLRYNRQSERVGRTRPPRYESRVDYDDPRNNQLADRNADELYDSALRARRNSQRNSSSSSRDGRRPPRFSNTSQGHDAHSVENKNGRTSSSSGSNLKRRRGGNGSRRNNKRSKGNDNSSSRRSSGPPEKTTAVPALNENGTSRKSGGSLDNRELPDELKPKVEELKAASKSMDYVSLINIAKSRHVEEFMDLKDEPCESTYAPSGRLHRHKYSIYTRNDEGNKGKLLEVIGEAPKIKEAKQNAAGKLLMEMLNVNPNLQYKHGKVKKVKRPGQSGQAGESAAMPSKSPKSIVEELKSANVLFGEIIYKSQPTKSERTDEDRDQKVMWQSTVTVILAEDDNVQISKTGFGSKKKEAEQEAAQLIINELLDRGHEKAAEIIGRVPKKKEEVPRGPDCKALGSPSETEVEDEGNGTGEEDANAAKEDDILFDLPGEVFALPEDYVVKVGWSPDECAEWVEENVFVDDASVGVYLESAELLNSIAPKDQTFEITECSAIVIATEKCALLVIEDECTDQWPPPCIKDLLENRKVNKVGYMWREAQLEGVQIAPILDIQDYSYMLYPPPDLSLTKLSLEQLVLKWGKKQFTPFNLKQIAGVVEEYGQLEELAGERVRPAVHVACASLAVVQAIDRKADAKIRGQMGVTAIPGFRDLMYQLFEASNSDLEADDNDDANVEVEVEVEAEAMAQEDGDEGDGEEEGEEGQVEMEKQADDDEGVEVEIETEG